MLSLPIIVKVCIQIGGSKHARKYPNGHRCIKAPSIRILVLCNILCKTRGARLVATFIEGILGRAAERPSETPLVHIVRADLVYTIREDEVVFRAHASRFALFSNPKVLKGGP